MMVDEDANPVIKKCIDFIWNKYKHFDGIELAKRTHLKGSGWYAAFQKKEEIISTEEMYNDTTV